MGWFTTSSTDTRAADIRSGAVAPSRSERQQCWASRDVYFACLDKHAILDAVKDERAAAKACPGEGREFERDCAREWVAHFKKWRVANHQKEMRIKALREQGANEMAVARSDGMPVTAKR